MLELSEAVTRQGRASEAAGYAKAAIVLDPADQRGRGHLESAPGRIAAGIAVLIGGGVAAALTFWAVYAVTSALPSAVRALIAGAVAYGVGALVLRHLLRALRHRRR